MCVRVRIYICSEVRFLWGQQGRGGVCNDFNDLSSKLCPHRPPQTPFQFLVPLDIVSKPRFKVPPALFQVHKSIKILPL